MLVRGHQIDARLMELSLNDYEFIQSAVEAGWSTPRIMRELDDVNPSIVFVVTRAARQEMAVAHRVCEHCRRKIASGRIEA